MTRWSAGPTGPASLTTGKPQNFPAYEPVPVFRVEVRDGDVYVDVQDVVPVD